MKTILKVAQIITALILIGLILLQSQEGGLSPAFRGGESYRTKRGLEKIIFIATAVFGALFLALSLLGTII